ncbi:hypothetical protein INR49_028603 [Caranx melampygus]|nr:hypothetical protein INR49_028603 [Caranx melampygus]
MNPVTNTTLSANMALISNALAAYTYVSDHPERAALFFVCGVCLGLFLTLFALVVQISCRTDCQPRQRPPVKKRARPADSSSDSSDSDSDWDTTSDLSARRHRRFERTLNMNVFTSAEELERAQRLEERERIIREIWMNGQPDIPGTRSLNRTLQYSSVDFPEGQHKAEPSVLDDKSAFHRPQTLSYKNGYALPRRPTTGIGQDPLLSQQLIQQEINELSFETPDMTYGSSDESLSKEFIPAHVALDKKVLRFYAYFEEDVLFSPDEAYRVRPVVIYYYLEDDSMLIYEPMVENSGIPQGKRIKRQLLPKNEHGEYYQWKDLNLGMDLEVYGVKYHITQCDAFTQAFMESEGIVLNDPEPTPVDPYSKRCNIPQPCFKTPSEFDSMHQFLTMDRKVLRFFALWDDTDSPCGITKPVTIHYYLVDDTVEIREIHEPNSGWDPFPILMRRQRLPKRIKTENFPSCVLEVSKHEVDEYYSPRDFLVGQTMMMLGRRFFLYDCDGYTKEYFQKNHPDIELKPTEVPKKADTLQNRKKEVPPYNGFGSLEDSLQNCLSLIPEPPKKNVVKMLENDHKVLRYSARLVSQNPKDEDRRFILSYFLANDMISIFERPTRNSGIMGGKFLEKARVPKPGSTVQNPEFYSPADFAIGASIKVFSHRFILTDADHYVLTYLEANSSDIPSETLDSLRQKLSAATANNQPDMTLPNQYSVEIAHLPVQPLVLGASQTKPHSQEHQGQSDHPCKHKADRPQMIINHLQPLEREVP